MRQRTQVICVDLDGTLSDYHHRTGLRPPAGSPLDDWQAFHQACAGDVPISGAVKTIQLLAQTYQIHIVSGRWDIMRAATEAWLQKHGVPYDMLRMYSLADRPTRNFVYKVQYVEQLRAQHLEPLLFLEDEQRNANYIQAQAHVPVLCISALVAAAPLAVVPA